MDERYHVHDLLAAYVLGAVTPEEAALVEEHLASCPLCRAQEAEFREVARALPLLAGELAPPPTLKARVMAIVEADPRARRGGAALADGDHGVGETTSAGARPMSMIPSTARAGQARWAAARTGRRGPGLGALLALAALLALVALGVGLWRALGVGGAPQPTHVYAVRATSPGHPYLGTLSYYRDGGRLELDLHGLRPTGPGRVYELWLIRLQGGRVVGLKGVKASPAPDGTVHLSAGHQDIRAYNAAGLTVERHFSPDKPTLPIVANAAI